MAYVITEPCIDVKDASCVGVCPVDAIFPEDQSPEEWHVYTQTNADYFRRGDDDGDGDGDGAGVPVR